MAGVQKKDAYIPVPGVETEWRVIKEAKDYSVSDAGRVRLDKTGVILTAKVTGTEKELVVRMTKGKSPAAKEDRRFFLVSRLVAEAFLQPLTKEHIWVTYKDGNVDNCHVTNLAWIKPRIISEPRQFAPEMTGYHGVGLDIANSKYRAFMTVDLGLHETEKEAAEAHDACARKFFGVAALLNFPTADDLPDLPDAPMPDSQPLGDWRESSLPL